MADIEEKIAEIYTDVKWIKKELVDIHNDYMNHEQRIRNLEKFRSEVIGALTVISFIVSIIIGYLSRGG